jgi:hypothetical protein
MTLPEQYMPKRFKGYEFLPPREYKHWGCRGMALFMDVRVLITADQLREFFGAPVTFNDWKWGGSFRYRGYRPDSFYDQQGLSSYKSGSQHRFGRAGDCDIKGVTATEARDIIMNHQAQFPWIRRLEDDVNWVHFDVANIHHHGIHLFKP